MVKTKFIQTYSSEELDDLFISQFVQMNEDCWLILKAHIIIERILISYVQRKLQNSKALCDINLSFRQILAFAESFGSNEKHEWIWPCLSNLNKLRNELAHEIQGESFDIKLRTFVDSTEPWIYVGNIQEEEKFLVRLMILCKAALNILH